MKITLKRKSADAETLRETIRQQKARIEELKRENADLLFSLDEYTKKENSILESIGYLEEKKREQTESLNKKYAAELEKLNFFEEKWLGIVKNSDDPTLKVSVARTRETLRACRDEILRATRRELKISKIRTAPEEDYLTETARLGALPKDDGFDPDAGFTPAEYLKYRRAAKDAIAEDKTGASDPAPSDRLPKSAEPVGEDDRGAPIPDREGGFERLRSRFQVGGSNRGDSMQEDFSKKIDRAAYDKTDCATEACRYDDFPPAPKRDESTAPAVSEPPEPVSPKKMSDKEIMSLLERLSV